MRTTLTRDDDLLPQAQQISGLTERTQLISRTTREIFGAEARCV